MLIKLKVTLLERGVSQADFAQRVGITATVLSEVIHGRRRANEALRAKIASSLAVNEAWLFEEPYVGVAVREEVNESVSA